jgi:hypothetical protein
VGWYVWVSQIDWKMLYDEHWTKRVGAQLIQFALKVVGKGLITAIWLRVIHVRLYPKHRVKSKIDCLIGVLLLEPSTTQNLDFLRRGLLLSVASDDSYLRHIFSSVFVNEIAH